MVGLIAGMLGLSFGLVSPEFEMPKTQDYSKYTSRASIEEVLSAASSTEVTESLDNFVIEDILSDEDEAEMNNVDAVGSEICVLNNTYSDVAESGMEISLDKSDSTDKTDKDSSTKISDGSAGSSGSEGVDKEDAKASTKEDDVAKTFVGTYSLTAYVATGSPCADGVYPILGYTAACNDPALWHKKIYIEGVGNFYVHDTGGMASNVIDLFVPSYGDAVNFGVRNANVYIVE